MTNRTVMRTLVVAAALAAGALPRAAHAQAIQMKTGGWDMSYTRSAEMKGLPPGLENLPPEKRAKVEAALRESGKPKTEAAKVCLTKADLAEMAKGPDRDEDCRYENVKVSGTHWSGDTVCKSGVTGHTDLDAPSPDRVSGKSVMKIPSSKGPSRVDLAIEGRWASASCKGYEE